MTETNLIEDLRLLAPPGHGWIFLVVALAGLALIGAGVRRWRRRTGEAATVADGPPPWEVALAALEKLVPLLRAESSREYGIAATTILRAYIEVRHGLRAPRLATEEFLLAARQSSSLPASHRESLGRFLALCDLFKFGRYVGSTAELTHLHTAAVDFVLASRPGGPLAVGEGA